MSGLVAVPDHVLREICDNYERMSDERLGMLVGLSGEQVKGIRKRMGWLKLRKLGGWSNLRRDEELMARWRLEENKNLKIGIYGIVSK